MSNQNYPPLNGFYHLIKLFSRSISKENELKNMITAIPMKLSTANKETILLLDDGARCGHAILQASFPCCSCGVKLGKSTCLIILMLLMVLL